MSNPTLFKTRAAGAAIAAYRIIKPGAAAGQVIQAAAATDALMGTSHQLAAKVAGDMVDVAVGGHPEVELGGTVAAGDPLTADADGKAIKAEPAAGANVRIIGFADQAGTNGAVIPYTFAPGFMQG